MYTRFSFIPNFVKKPLLRYWMAKGRATCSDFVPGIQNGLGCGEAMDRISKYPCKYLLQNIPLYSNVNFVYVCKPTHISVLMSVIFYVLYFYVLSKVVKRFTTFSYPTKWLKLSWLVRGRWFRYFLVNSFHWYSQPHRNNRQTSSHLFNVIY